MSFIKNSVIYLGSSVLNKSLPLLLLPLLTAYLTPSEFGLLSLFQIFVTFFLACVGMAMQTNIASQFFEVPKESIAKLTGNICFILLCNVVLVLILCGFLYWLGFRSLFTVPMSAIFCAVIVCGFTVSVEVFTTILRCRGEALAYGKMEVSFAIIRAILIVCFLLIFSQGWLSQVYGMLGSAMILGVYALYALNKSGYLCFEKDLSVIRSVLKLSLPLIPHIIGGVIIGMSDRLFIERMVSIEVVGIYSVGYTFGMIVMLFIDAFIKAWSPWFYKTLSSATAQSKRKVVSYIYLYIASVIVFSLLVAIVSKFLLPYFVGDAFLSASEYILWVSLGYAMQGVYKIFFPFLVYLKKTHFLAISTVVAALINLVLNYYLIVLFGAIGAAYATIVAFLVSAVLVFLIQKNFYDMPWLTFIGKTNG